MTDFIVDGAAGVLSGPFGRVPCRIGRGGVCPAAEKREGDGCTPAGRWPLRGALFRRGRVAPPPGFALPWRWIGRTDGWSDDPADPAYNRAVAHPHPFSAERLWRQDGLYDAVVVLGYNDRPPVPGRGSAIFLHLAGDGPTEGCVALRRESLLPLFAAMQPVSHVHVS